VAGLFFVLVATKTNSQPNINPRNLFFETTNITSDGVIDESTGIANSPEETCRANFEESPTPNSTLSKKFIAEPWHSEGKRPVYICWKFGDGKDTCIQYSNTNPGPYTVVHYYQRPGVYEVCVRIVYEGGCEATKCKPVYVTIPDACRADFEKLALTPSISPLDVTFKALPWHNNNKKPKKICWSFGDGRDTCIEYSTTFTGTYLVRHKYNHPGTYEICVKILYDGGCEASKCKPVTINEPDRCGADFERIPVTNTNDLLVAGFKAIPSHNNNKVPKVICWKFGDGKDTCIEYAQNFSGPYVVRHKYNAPGTYTVCVKITYYGGCESYKCKPIVITRPDECRADFEKISTSATANPLLVYFKALPWNSNNKKPKTICWRFGDGKDTCINYTESYTGTYAVSHRYDQPGQYEVCIKITYFGGCESYKCKQINVGEFCRADFEKLLVNTTANPLVAYFKALPFNSQDRKPKTTCWRFGDGRDTCINYPENYTGSYGVRHEYDHPGLYEVCIKITYYGGCEAYKCKTIQVGEPIRCKADFERIPISTVSNPLHVAFKAIPWHIENKKPKEICWKFGDGRDTCIQYGEDYAGPYVVNHRYDRPGNYEVCVKILYFGGCESRKCEVVKIEAPGECRVKLFQLTPSITSPVRGFFASPWSSENKRPARVCWYFGDGTDTCIQLNSGISLTQLFIRHAYPAPGEYRACVKILFEGGCIASDCDEVIIRPTTNACGGYMTDSLISPRTFKFKGFAIHNPDDPVAGYRWTFGDGSAATGREVTHQYNAPGTYEVCLTIKTQRGCETRICKPLHVPGNTQIALQITPNPVINTMHVLFYSTHNEPVMIKVVNGYGVVVRIWTRNATQGANNWDFDVSTLPAGAYTLYVQSPNQLSSQLFIKAN
jgi:PKD repeat protein